MPIDDVLGRFGRELVQRVGDAPDWPARFALIDAAIRTRLADAAPVDAGVEWSLQPHHCQRRHGDDSATWPVNWAGVTGG